MVKIKTTKQAVETNASQEIVTILLECDTRPGSSDELDEAYATLASLVPKHDLIDCGYKSSARAAITYYADKG